MSKKQGFKEVKKTAGKVAVQEKKNYYWMIIFSVLLAFIAFAPVFKADFVNWDDPDYVGNNKAIQSLSNFKEIVTTPVQGNYHPLTMLSLAMNYAISAKDAKSYHVVNVLLHLLNVILVFFFVYRISGRKQWMAFVTALLFAIHPLHVESVAWVAERKDVLYSLFFLAGLIYYLRYLEKRSVLNLSIVLLLFVLSLLSKPAAIIFPIVLLAIDYFYDRLKNTGTYIEKIPFLVFSVIFGLLTLHGQSLAGAVDDGTIFSFQFRFFFGFYGIMMYLVKAIVPLGLSTFYPFPPVNNSLPVIYYISPFVTLLLAVIFIRTFRRNKVIAFGILFYLINLALVLQFIPVGSAVIADRYTYIPLIGIFMIAGFYFQKWMDSNSGKNAPAAIALLVAVSFILSLLTYKQASTWKNSASLWDHAISVAPSSRAYNNRGLIYKKENQYPKAIEMYTMAIKLNKAEKEALVNRGNVYFNEKKYELAIEDYNKCLAIDSLNKLAIENRGAANAAIGNYDLALPDMDRSLRLNPNSVNGYANRAMVHQLLNNHQAAITDFYHHMKITPDENGDIWNAIGVSHLNLGENTKAIESFDKAVKLKENPVFLNNRALASLNSGNNQQAQADVKRLNQLGAAVDPAVLSRLK